MRRLQADAEQARIIKKSQHTAPSTAAAKWFELRSPNAVLGEVGQSLRYRSAPSPLSNLLPLLQVAATVCPAHWLVGNSPGEVCNFPSGILPSSLPGNLGL